MDKAALLKQTQDNELIRFLGIEIVEVSPERVVLTMEVTPKVHQYVGIMNGGVSMFLAEKSPLLTYVYKVRSDFITSSR